MQEMERLGIDSERKYVRGCYHAVDGRVIYVTLFGIMYLRDTVGQQTYARLLAKKYNSALTI